jgi:tRNA A-37 threonylcarbamoyl transferase component Bud32
MTSGDASPLGDLPRSGPLAEFASGAETLSRPEDPSRPWVLARDERVVKAYDLRAFDDIDRQRAMAEAETALAVSDIDGVVTTHQVDTDGHWLIIEMERLGETVADHLADVRESKRPPLSPQRWGQLLNGVAHALAALHGCHRVHRDVKPANLIFDRAGEKLVLADFSIASRLSIRSQRWGRGEDAERTSDLSGTDRYIAPELFLNRLGYAADQYGLAVTAADVLDKRNTPAVDDVLRRATAQDPGDRYPSILDFGRELEAAIDGTVPRRLSSRLQRISPKWRYAWGPGAIVAAVTYAVLLVLRIPDLPWRTVLVIPLMFGGATTVTFRAVSRLRRRRTQPRLAIADRAWFPPLLFAVVFLLLRPLMASDPSLIGKFALYAAIAAIVIPSLLGSTHRDAGSWLIRLARRWEGWRDEHRGKRVEWWGFRIVAISALAFVVWLPVAVSARWPNNPPPSAAARPMIAVVGALRQAMLQDRTIAACRLTRVPSEPGSASCREWMPLAASWLRQDVRSDGAPPLTPSALTQVEVIKSEQTASYSEPSWTLRAAGIDRRLIGIMGDEGTGERVWKLSVTRRPPEGDPLSVERSYWTYEIVRHSRRWAVTSVEVCALGALPACEHLTQMTPAKLVAARGRGAPRLPGP